MKESINWKNKKEGTVTSIFETTNEVIERDIKQLEQWIEANKKTLNDLEKPIILTKEEQKIKEAMNKIKLFDDDQLFRSKFKNIENTIKDLKENLEINKKRLENRKNMLKTCPK